MKNITCYQLPSFEPISRDMWRYHAATITGLEFSPDGKKLASVAIDTHLMIYQPENITKVTQVKGTTKRLSLSIGIRVSFACSQVLIL